MIIDLLGGSYENLFKDWNFQRTINWYPKISQQKDKDKTQMALFPRPGLTQFVDLGGNEAVRGLFTARTLTQERCFAVVGTTLWEILFDGSTVSLGSLNGMSTGSWSKVYMAVNSNEQLMIQDPLAGYIFNMNSNTLTQITDLDYPNGTTLDYSDGYFIISDKNGRVTFSELLNGTNWTGFNFFTPTFKPDRVKAIVACREEIYCFGQETIEVYINNGTDPFIRQARTSMYYGLTARDSVAVHPAGVFFLGNEGSFGGNKVYLMGSNYSVTPISDPAIEQRINESSNENAEGYVFDTKDGHIFYHLHLPDQQVTLVHDLTTGFWHERQSVRPYPDVDGTKPFDMYRGRLHTVFKGKNLFGDWFSGKIFKEEGKTDDGEIRLCRRISPVFHNELKYISANRLEIDVNSGEGNGPVMMLRYSLDGGNTFENEEHIKLGELGEYDYRAQIRNLGTSRNWVVDFSVSDPEDVIVMQAVLNGSYGAF